MNGEWDCEEKSSTVLPLHEKKTMFFFSFFSPCIPCGGGWFARGLSALRMSQLAAPAPSLPHGLPSQPKNLTEGELRV